MFYIDTSAAMRLVADETHSAALREWLAVVPGQVVGSDLLRTELLRATRRAVPKRMVRAREVLDSMDLLAITTAVCERAAGVDPGLLRSLDALHLASAMELGDELDGVVTYDERLAEAARANGVKVISPR